MVEAVIIDGQKLNPEQVLVDVASLTQKKRSTEAFNLFKKLASHNPANRNFNYVKALYLQGGVSSFLVIEALRKELEMFPDNEQARTLLRQVEGSLQRDPQRLSEAFPLRTLFSLVMVVADDWRETHRAIRAVLHQVYPYVEIVVVQRAPDPAVAQTLTALDSRVRVLEGFGKSFWEAMQFGLQSTTGEYQMVVPNGTVVFSDTAFVVLGTILRVASKAEFFAGSRAFVSESGFVDSFRAELPKFSRRSFLDEENLVAPTLRLDFAGVIWSSGLFRRVGNRLATELHEAVDFELFMRFFREVQLVSIPMPLSFGQAKTVMNSELLSVRYVKEALTLIREEKRKIPLAENEPLVGPSFTTEDIIGKPAVDTAPGIVWPPAPSTVVGRFLMSNAPVISLVMPSYNQSEFLEQAIDSVLSQGYPRLEFMIIDGGSTDGSGEIIKRYEKYLTYWCAEKDEGQYFAIQKGLDRSTGEVMGWLNSDDKLGRSALVYLGLIFLVYPHIRWLSGRGGSSITKTGAEVFYMQTTAFSRGRYLREGFDRPYIQQEGTFWRRSLWEEAGGSLDLRYSLAGDCELWHRFFRFSQLHSVDLPIGLFRQHDQQRSQLLRVEYLREALQVVRNELELINGGLYTEMLPAPEILTHSAITSLAEACAAEWQAKS
jgi:hypothetical protein